MKDQTIGKRGKNVDPGWMSGNLAAGIGGLSSFQGMVNDVYELEYKALMNDPDKKSMLMSDFMKSDDKNSKNKMTALELFCKPHIFGGINSITRGVNKISLKDKK